MKLSRADLLLMRRSLLVTGVSILASIMLLYSGTEYTRQTQKNLHLAQSQLAAARSQLSAMQNDQKNMTAYADEYGALIEEKIIGDEQRLDWVEGIENIRQQNLVMAFRYNIAPQKAYPANPPIDSGNFDIRYSEMKLQFELLHEAQLLDFLAALRGQIKGLYHLKECTLQRSDTNGINEQRTTARLRAECGGGWVTLKSRNFPK